MPWEIWFAIGVILACLCAGIVSYARDRISERRSSLEMYKHLQVENIKRIKKLR